MDFSTYLINSSKTIYKLKTVMFKENRQKYCDSDHRTPTMFAHISKACSLITILHLPVQYDQHKSYLMGSFQ